MMPTPSPPPTFLCERSEHRKDRERGAQPRTANPEPEKKYMPRYCFLELDTNGEPCEVALAKNGSFIVDICRECFSPYEGSHWSEQKELINEIADAAFYSEKRHGGGEAFKRFGDEGTMAASINGHCIPHPPYDEQWPPYRCEICSNSLNEGDDEPC